MSVNSVSTQTDPSHYQNHSEVTKKAEDPHTMMRDLLTTPTHVDSLKAQSNIMEMPEEVEALLNMPAEQLEQALMNYMDKKGLNSMTFINLDDNGNVASIVTVTKSPDNGRELNFKQSQRNEGGEVPSPYIGNLHDYSQIKDFHRFTHPTPTAASDVTPRKPHVAYQMDNRAALEKITGHRLHSVHDMERSSFTEMTYQPRVKRTRSPEREHDVKRPRVDTNDKENTQPKRKSKSNSHQNNVNITSKIHIGNVYKNVMFDHVNINGNQKSGAHEFSTQTNKPMKERTALEAGMKGFDKGMKAFSKGMEALSNSMNNSFSGINVGNITQTFTENDDGTKTVSQSIGSLKQSTTLGTQSTRPKEQQPANPQTETSKPAEASGIDKPQSSHGSEPSINISFAPGTKNGNVKTDHNVKTTINMEPGSNIKVDASPTAEVTAGDTVKNYFGIPMSTLGDHLIYEETPNGQKLST